MKPKLVVRRGTANVPFVKTNTGSREVVELLAASPEEVEVAVEEELTLTLTEGTLELEVTRLEVVRPPETLRPRRVPRTRQIGNNERKRGVQSTCREEQDCHYAIIRYKLELVLSDINISGQAH